MSTYQESRPNADRIRQHIVWDKYTEWTTVMIQAETGYEQSRARVWLQVTRGI